MRKQMREQINELHTMRSLILAQQEYYEFLGSIIDKHAGFLSNHGITTPDEDIVKGQKLRNKIKRLQAKLKTGGN